MKINKIFAIAIIASVAAMPAFIACSSDDDNPKADSGLEYTELAQLKEGQILNRMFTYNNVKITLEDELVNFGDEEMPILFAVNKKIKVEGAGSDKDLGDVVFVADREKINSFLARYAQSMGLPYATKEDKVEVAELVHSYFAQRDIDINLFMTLVTEGYDIADLKKLEGKTRGNDASFNGALYTLWQRTPDKGAQTRGTLKDIKGIIEGVIDLYNMWNDFAENNQPIAVSVDGTAHFINGADMDPANYNLGGHTAMQTSPKYELEYWVSGIWHSQFTYVIETMRGEHAEIPGQYVPYARIRTTHLDVQGPAFIGSGSYMFSPAINISKQEGNPIVQVDGSVQVVYGDCCCFRFFSYLNFSLSGNDGYNQVSFSKG